MTVRELIERLSKLDPDRLVVLQKDGEGNGHSPLDVVDANAVYVAESTWSGEVYLETLTEKLESEGYTEADLDPGDDAVPCVVLVPVN